jgi:hypothetical protein
MMRSAIERLFHTERIVKTRLLLVVLLSLGARSVGAQSPDPYFTTFSANYDLIYQQRSDVSNVGVHLDGAYTVKRDLPFIGIVGEVGANHFVGSTIFSFLGGGRLRIPVADDRFLPFAQLLLGAYHCGPCHETKPALQVGGGVDFRLSNSRIRIRAQLDVRHVFTEFVGFDALRLGGGIVLPLNRQ